MAHTKQHGGQGAAPADPGRRASRVAALGVVVFICGLVLGVLVDRCVWQYRLPAAEDVHRGLDGQAVPDSANRNATGHVVAIGRSPIPQPGEHFAAPIRLRHFSRKKLPPLPEAGQTITWERARDHLGETITVEGKVMRARNTGSVCFLDFAMDWKDKFYVIIFTEALNGWDQPPEHYFLNKRIRVAGTVSTYRERPQIRVSDPRQIALVRD